jgi:protein phosphatase
LPPTVSPSETTTRAGLLEHPAEAFSYYRHEGIASVICEEKHMGSRAIVVVCRDEDAARGAFGVAGEGVGMCYTRTGRRFFEDGVMEAELLERVRVAAEGSGLFDLLSTSWLLLDCELMPWSQKAQELLRLQYAAVGSAATAALPEVVTALTQAANLDGIEAMHAQFAARLEDAGRYVDAYRRYCWPVATTDDLKLAPFHLLASEGAVHIDKTHGWHLEQLGELAAADTTGVIVPTRSLVVDTTDEETQDKAIAWWEEMTGSGGEGMVVKPYDFVVRGRRGLAQPALKCRGSEYLRIIYGPEYAQPANLERLRRRSLGAKRSLALREFALGIEGLERFTRGEPLRRVHECAFAVLSLESEPVDPRL